MVRAFYAGGKTRTPLLVALLGAVVSICTAYSGLQAFNMYPVVRDTLASLLRLEGVVGIEVLVLAFAFVVGVIIEMCILLFMAIREFGLVWKALLAQCLEATLAAFVGALSAYTALVFLVDGVNQETFIGIMLQGGIAGVMGVLGVIVTYYILGSKELSEIYRSYHSKIFKTDVIAPQQDTL